MREFMGGEENEERENKGNWIGGERIEQQDRVEECLSAKERKLPTQSFVSLSICDLWECYVM